MDARQMICEGHCNPQRLAVEAKIPKASSRQMKLADQGFTKITAVPDTVAAELRKLRHTPHRAEGAGWVCQLCGTSRE